MARMWAARNSTTDTYAGLFDTKEEAQERAHDLNPYDAVEVDTYTVYFHQHHLGTQVIVDAGFDDLEEVIDQAIDTELRLGNDGLFSKECPDPEYADDDYYSSAHNLWIPVPGAPNVRMPDGTIQGGM